MQRQATSSRQTEDGPRRMVTKKTLIASERDRPDVARRRAQWTTYQGRIDPKRLVFIDETWTKTNMASLRGWAPRGRRLVAKVPHGRWKTMTFLAALLSIFIITFLHPRILCAGDTS